MDTPTSPDPAFLAQVASAHVLPGELALWYIGGAGYIIRSVGVTMLIDPFLGPGNPPEWVRISPPAFEGERLGDLGEIAAVLLTHEHDDHTDPVALGAIGRLTSAPVYGPGTSIGVARSLGLPDDRCQIVTPNQQVTFGDVQLTAVAMHDPMAQSCIGWVIDTGTMTILHCGDSLYHAGFVELGQRWTIAAMCVSVGCNPPGTTFYMDASDAARAARDAGTKTLIPQHFDLWERTRLDPERVVAAAREHCPDVRVLPARLRGRTTISPAGSR